MIINLIPDFLTILEGATSNADRIAAYHAYFDRNRELLSAYWENYVVEPHGPHFEEVIENTVEANRDDLLHTIRNTDLVGLAEKAEREVSLLLKPDIEFDIVLMVGVGAANAGELVVNGRGIAFVCLEHFTGVNNPDTQGLGLDAELIPMWLAHELTHVIRYTSPGSRSELRLLVEEAGGYYSYWETGRRATLRELLMNEGLAVQVSREISPGHATWEYFGFARKQYTRIRELEPVIHRGMERDFDSRGLGLRLRYLSGGMSDDARRTEHVIMPERAGYFIGARIVEPAIRVNGFAWAVRASAEELAEGGVAVEEQPRLRIVR